VKRALPVVREVIGLLFPDEVLESLPMVCDPTWHVALGWSGRRRKTVIRDE